MTEAQSPRPGWSPGRNPGARNKKTLAKIKLIENGKASGLTPLEVMLDNMRFAHDKATELMSQLEKLVRDDGKPKDKLASFREMMRFRDMSQSCARDVAPFMHPRLTSIAVKAPEPAGGTRYVVEGGLPRRPEWGRKPTEDEVRGIIEGTALDITPRGPEE